MAMMVSERVVAAGVEDPSSEVEISSLATIVISPSFTGSLQPDSSRAHPRHEPQIACRLWRAVWQGSRAFLSSPKMAANINLSWHVAFVPLKMQSFRHSPDGALVVAGVVVWIVVVVGALVEVLVVDVTVVVFVRVTVSVSVLVDVTSQPRCSCSQHHAFQSGVHAICQYSYPT